jgi:hypothetical protein
MSDDLTEVGRTSQSYWNQIATAGFLDDYPGAIFEITQQNTSPEITFGMIKIRQEDVRRFLRLKEHMKEQNGGRWIID